MQTIHLLRCKAEPLPQSDAFAEDMTPVEVISKSFMERPTTRVKRGSTWHIGNTLETKLGAISFALGRDAILKAPQFDEQLREFKEIEQAQAPFTIGVFDPEHQTIGVVIRRGVSLNAAEVAGKLEILLESTGIARKANRKINVDFIPDPTSFIESIREAYRVTRFEFSFTLPNPPGDDKYIQRPLKDYALKAKATHGMTAFLGNSLDKDQIVETATAVAASGDDANVNLQPRPKAHSIKKYLNSNAMRKDVQIDEVEGMTAGILKAMNDAFDYVRHRVRIARDSDANAMARDSDVR